MNELTEHPRAGGDDERAHRRYVAVPGTPPRGRGRLRRHGCERRRTRNTPARAGTTWSRTSLTSPIREHPRAGGDDPRNQRRHGGRSGNTPARAGDDPHRRGRHGCRYGTPPRGRGRQEHRPRPPVPVRNTPARAGTTRPVTRPQTRGQEHPRAGGDDFRTSMLSWIHCGTPPRGRGRRVHRRGEQSLGGTPPRGRGRLRRDGERGSGQRNTPARAGTTSPWAPGSPYQPEHPRAGGDDDDHHGVVIEGAGTPPRGRGRRRGPSGP